MMKRKNNESCDHPLKDECLYQSSLDLINLKRQCTPIRKTETETRTIIPYKVPKQKVVRNIVPSPWGVSEAVNLIMGEDNIVFIPTESVYMACTSIYLSKLSSAQEKTLQQLLSICPITITGGGEGSPPIHPFILLIPNPESLLNCYCFDHLWRKKPYALCSSLKGIGKTIMAKNVIKFSEVKEILHRLMKRFCPSPLILYLRTSVNSSNSRNNNIATTEREKSDYIAISNPSHPLAKRVIEEASSSSSLLNNDNKKEKKVIVGVPSLQQYHHEDDISYTTKASNISSSVFISSKEKATTTTFYALNGEDKQETFAVPTCQYGKPFYSSLWIDDTSRTLHIRGKHNDCKIHEEKEGEQSSNSNIIDISEENVLQAIRYSNTITKNEKQKYRNQLICSVLFKWKVIDERTR